VEPLVQRAHDLWIATTPDDPTVENWRIAIDELFDTFGTHDDARVERLDADGVPVVRVQAPGADSDHVVVHFHSGGYVMGSADKYQEFGYRLSAATGRPVYVVDYRLAPEHRYPAQLEDALSVHRWLLQRMDASRIAYTGDSAGGGLVFSLLIALRDAGEPLPAVASTMSALTDLAAEGGSHDRNRATDPVVNRELAVGMGAVFLGEGRDPKQTPLGSPLYGDHHGLPPVLLQASEAETLLDDSTRLAASIVAAGGIAELVTYPDVPHVWAAFPFLPQAQHAMDRIAEFLAVHAPDTSRTR
jgi:acetyl esterase/lipase